MLLKIARILLTLVICAYLLASVMAFNRMPADRVCTDIILSMKDTLHAQFITRQEVYRLLKAAHVDCIGIPISEVRTDLMEQALREHALIERAECYKTPDCRVCVELSQRIPILRVMSKKSGDYYIDNKGQVMAVDLKCATHLPVATGEIEKAFARDKLYKFALFLQKNAFWRAQVEQINVLPNGRVEIIPRVGDHIIDIGTPDHVAEKLKRVRYFYEHGLNRVGWNKYSRINVEFDNQIICTRR